MDILVQYGADVSMRTDHGVTVLHWASLLAKPKVIVRLIEKYNADVNAIDDYYYTPLMYAIARKDKYRRKIIEALKKHGAVLYFKDNQRHEVPKYANKD